MKFNERERKRAKKCIENRNNLFKFQNNELGVHRTLCIIRI